jgi:AcrR family transcriptional regulator
MRYEKGHKDATRRRILEVASRQFRENGVAAAGLAGIMAEAGLTNGAFYAHFKSKEDLLRAALADALAAARRRFGPRRSEVPVLRPQSVITCRRATATTPAAAVRRRRWSPRSHGIRARRAMPSPAR